MRANCLVGIKKELRVKACLNLLMGAVLMLAVVGCASPGEKAKDLRLGMTPDEVTDVMDEPTTIRAAKVYEDGQTQQVWEYIHRWSFDPRDYWVFFENDKVVQWGNPGDFSGKSGRSVPVDEYKAVKQTR